jgi:hypothetical protein
VTAAAHGSDAPPDRFTIDWRVGGAADRAAGVNLLPPADGLSALAARYGMKVEESSP